MVKHTQTIRRQKRKNCLSMFDHFVGFALKGLRFCLTIKYIFLVKTPASNNENTLLFLET